VWRFRGFGETREAVPNIGIKEYRKYAEEHPELNL
jgi:hypothetical protein